MLLSQLPGFGAAADPCSDSPLAWTCSSTSPSVGTQTLNPRVSSASLRSSDRAWLRAGPQAHSAVCRLFLGSGCTEPAFLALAGFGGRDLTLNPLSRVTSEFPTPTWMPGSVTSSRAACLRTPCDRGWLPREMWLRAAKDMQFYSILTNLTLNRCRHTRQEGPTLALSLSLRSRRSPGDRVVLVLQATKGKSEAPQMTRSLSHPG